MVKSKEEAARNHGRMSRVRGAVRQLRETADPGEAARILPRTHGELDRASSKGILKKRTASRLKSRLARRVNRAQGAGTAK
jgi:small subunit ribosomal protein S20